MENSSDAVKHVLLRENEEFQRLSQKHQELDAKLHALAGRTFLSEDEKLEEVSLKKQKLALKDRMAEIIRKHQGRSALRAPGAPTPPA